VKTLIDVADAPVFAVPSVDAHGRPAVHEGVLVEGAQGWGEFSPPDTASDVVAARWLTAATEAGTIGWPDVLRGRIPVAVAVPAVPAERAHRLVAESGCRAADVTVGLDRDGHRADLDRVEAVRDALGAGGALRCHAGGRWDADAAVRALGELDAAAGGLEFVGSPCATADELAVVRRQLDIPVAADESLYAAADIVLLSASAAGGVRRALRLAERRAKPVVVVSAGETSIGLSAGVALAGALPALPYSCALGTIGHLGGDLVSDVRTLRPVDGALPVAPMPPAPDPEQLSRHTVTDPVRVQRWRTRLQSAAAAI